MCLWPVVNSVTPQPIFLEVTRVFRHAAWRFSGHGLLRRLCATDTHCPCRSVHDATLDNHPAGTTVCHSRAVCHQQTTPGEASRLLKGRPPAVLRAASSPPSHCRNSHHSNDRRTPHLTLVAPIPSRPQRLATTRPAFCLYGSASSGWCGPRSTLGNCQTAFQCGYTPQHELTEHTHPYA